MTISTHDLTQLETQIDGQSMNLTEHNIEQLKQLFPNVFREGKIDFEVLIKYGLPLTLTLPIEQINIQNNGQIYQAWNIANNALITYFDENLTLEAVQSIAALSTQENPVLRVVFSDTSFHNDVIKTNSTQRLKQAGIEDVLSI